MACCTSISPTSLPDGTVGVPYFQNMIVQPNGCSNSGISFQSGSLPPGLSFVPAFQNQASIFGTPTTPGTFNFTLRINPGAEPCGFSDHQYSITINAPSDNSKKDVGGGAGFIPRQEICVRPNNAGEECPQLLQYRGFVYVFYAKDENGKCCYKLRK